MNTILVYPVADRVIMVNANDAFAHSNISYEEALESLAIDLNLEIDYYDNSEIVEVVE